MVLGSMLLGGALVAGGAVLYRAVSRPKRIYVDRRVYVSSPSVNPSKYKKLRSEMDAVQQSLELSSEVLANMLFAQVEGDPRKSLETLVKGAGYTLVQPLLLETSGVEVFGTQGGSADEPVLISFSDESGKRVYGVGVNVKYHGEFFVPKGATGDRELHIVDYSSLIVIQPLNLPVSGRFFLPEPKRKSRKSPEGYIVQDTYDAPIKDMLADVSDEEARQASQRIAVGNFLKVQQDVKRDERMLAQRLENAWNDQFNIVPITEREPQCRGSEATAYLRDRLQKRLNPQ